MSTCSKWTQNVPNCTTLAAQSLGSVAVRPQNTAEQLPARHPHKGSGWFRRHRSCQKGQIRVEKPKNCSYLLLAQGCESGRSLVHLPRQLPVLQPNKRVQMSISETMKLHSTRVSAHNGGSPRSDRAGDGPVPALVTGENTRFLLIKFLHTPRPSPVQQHRAAPQTTPLPAGPASSVQLV